MTTEEYIENVIEIFKTDFPNIKYKKMFGDYMVYINNKPIILVCDNNCYVKIHDNIIAIMQDADVGYPYEGAKLHYILDIDNKDTAVLVINELEKVTFIKPKKITFNKNK